jgi:hypothetical protein
MSEKTICPKHGGVINVRVACIHVFGQYKKTAKFREIIDFRAFIFAMIVSTNRN